MRNSTRELADGFHFLRLRQSTLAFPQRFFDVTPVTDVMNHAREIAAALRIEFAYRQVQRERRAIFAAATHLPTNADDFSDACAEVVGDIAVMLAAVGLRHQNFHVLAD